MASKPKTNKQVHVNNDGDDGDYDDTQPDQSGETDVFSKNDLRRLSTVHGIPLHIEQAHKILNNCVLDYILRRLDSAVKIANNSGDNTLYAAHL